MKQARCPICERDLPGQSRQDLPHHPFCSERCRTIDLARWLDQRYTLPAEPAGADWDEEFESSSHSP